MITHKRHLACRKKYRWKLGVRVLVHQPVGFKALPLIASHIAIVPENIRTFRPQAVMHKCRIFTRTATALVPFCEAVKEFVRRIDILDMAKLNSASGNSMDTGDRNLSESGMTTAKSDLSPFNNVLVGFIPA
jgi:hypothetical protein